jgi:hypothetical protein
LLTAAAPTTVAAMVFISSRPPLPGPSVLASTRTMLQSGQTALTMSMSRPVSPDQPGQSSVDAVLTVPSVPTRAKHAVPPGVGTPLPSVGHAGRTGMPYCVR